MKTFLTLLLLAAATIVRAADDPYAALPSLDFGKPNSMQAIWDEARATTPSGHAAIEAKLLKAATTPGATFACKRFVADMLRVVGTTACLPVVLKWLDDPQVADSALYALQGMPGKEVDAALLTAAPKTGIIQALAARRNIAIKQFVTSADPALRRAAIAGLGTVGTAEAAAILQSLKTDGEAALIVCAARLLKDGDKKTVLAICPEQFRNTTRPSIATAALNLLVEADANAAIPTVLQALEDKRGDVALHAASAARFLPHGVTRDLCSTFPKLTPSVQVALLCTLGLRGDRTALPTIKAALASADDAVKTQAIRACEPLADESLIEPLLALAAQNTVAQETLGRMNLPTLDNMMLAKLSDTDSTKVVSAINVLRTRANRKAMSSLLKLAESKDKTVAQAALRALDGFAGQSEVVALTGILQRADDRNAVARILWAALRGVSDKDKRFVALWQLAPTEAALLALAPEGGGTESFKIVKANLSAGDVALKEAAVRALFAWKEDDMVEPTLQILKSTTDKKHKALGTRALANRLTERKCRIPAAKRVAMLDEALTVLDQPADKKQIEWAKEKLAEKK